MIAERGEYPIRVSKSHSAGTSAGAANNPMNNTGVLIWYVKDKTFLCFEIINQVDDYRCPKKKNSMIIYNS